MNEELRKELQGLRHYKEETFYRLIDEDIRMVLEDQFDGVEIDEEDVQLIKEAARSNLEINWVDYVSTFIDVRFPEIIKKYEKRQEEEGMEE